MCCDGPRGQVALGDGVAPNGLDVARPGVAEIKRRAASALNRPFEPHFGDQKRVRIQASGTVLGFGWWGMNLDPEQSTKVV